MTQYQAKCLNCGSIVSHLLPSPTVERCDECKGEKVKK